MTPLAGFLDVLLRGFGLVVLSLAVGGVAFALVALRAFREPSSLERGAASRSLTVIAWSGIGLVLTQVALLALKPWALAANGGPWPIQEFLRTEFAMASLVRIALALMLAGTAWRLSRCASSAGWAALAVLGGLLAMSSAFLSHGGARPNGRVALMTLDAAHALAAAVWVGGLAHLLVFWRRGPDRAVAASVLGRFSALAMAAVAWLVVAGLALTLSYVDSLAGLIGTAYGVMVLGKVVLLLAALLLGGLNFLAVRRLRAGAAEPAGRVRWLVEAELGLGLTVLLAAASLTSMPPAIDLVADRATLGEVAMVFAPKMPRFSSTRLEEMPVEDRFAPRTDADRAWSEYNHHTAGFFVLAMGLLAMVSRTRWGRWARHWPLIFLGLAAFLFVRNDPGAWPLGPMGFWQSMTYPEVLQHRFFVLLVVAFAAFEWAVRTGRVRSQRAAFVFPLLCAGGGALLLTHSHAMLNLKSEFLAEVSHMPLGILGVIVGWSRWLELRLPPPANQIPGRVWVASMVLIGILLVFYREV
jgi:putative copper resistance protein D